MDEPMKPNDWKKIEEDSLAGTLLWLRRLSIAGAVVPPVLMFLLTAGRGGWESFVDLWPWIWKCLGFYLLAAIAVEVRAMRLLLVDRREP